MKSLKHMLTQRKRVPVAELLALLNQVGRELTVSLDLKAVVRRALAMSVQSVDAAMGSMLLLNAEGQPSLSVFLHEGRFRDGDVALDRRMLQEGPAGQVVTDRQSALIPDLSADARWIQLPGETSPLTTGSAICVPLYVPHRTIGILTCIHPEVGYFDQDDVDILQFVADQAAVALENARLFAAEEQRRELAHTLSEIARTVTATLDLGEVLDLILGQLARVVLYDSASIFLLQNRRLVIRAWRGYEDAETVRNLTFEMTDDQIMTRAVSGGQPVMVADVQEESGWSDVPGMPPTRAWICVPLVARGDAIGALTVHSREAGTYDDGDTQVVAAFAGHAATAVANAHLLMQIQRRLEEVAFLHQTGQALTASLELVDVLGSLMNSVREHFQVEAASAALIDEETGEIVFRAASGAAASRVLGMRLKTNRGIAGWVARTGKPILVPAAREDPRFYNGIDEATGFRTGALLAVPIRLGQETIGVIEAMNPSDGHLDEGDLRLLLNVATLAASAIQNSGHYTRARDAEQRYASLFENSADPIVITDASGAITDVNRRFCEMLGYEKEQLLGREIASLCREPEATKEQLASALEGESIFYNIEAVSSDDSTVPLEVRATRVFHDRRPYVQWMGHDLSERLELERVRQDLTSMIIHDLRNPLSSVMSSLELIHTAVIDKTITIPVQELFHVAQRSGDRLYLLIDSILDLARLEDGQTELQRAPFDFSAMVKEAVNQMQPSAASRRTSLQSHLPDHIPPLCGDRDLLQRVVLNLLDNALKFTPPGGEVRVELSQPDAHTILCTTTDTGPGIPRRLQERIFERFARGYNQEARGTGLGLALCKLAVEAHNGRIWVESEVGQGSSFKFTLPLDEQEETA